jgi:hypothetical protein
VNEHWQRGSPHVPPAPRRFSLWRSSGLQDMVRHLAALVVVEKLETKLVYLAAPFVITALPSKEGAPCRFGAVASPQLSLRCAAISVHISNAVVFWPTVSHREASHVCGDRSHVAAGLGLPPNSFCWAACRSTDVGPGGCPPAPASLSSPTDAQQASGLCGLAGARRSQSSSGGAASTGAEQLITGVQSAARADESVWRL